ncbi:hypothetical protein JQ596_36285 [Bradyrhizobium manausense]|uniref:hypothetical protein n=1 Tax=Bradyrhizobium TaxID=374 RepID=UPI001BAD2A9E|nr:MULTISPECIES: hypothetical protein [Bradyrhizobium]MBR0830980.1 hypothetical protein [Bradyrhizobium manausense]
MGMIMVKCPQTGRAIPTGINSDRESFLRSIVFYGNTRCPICRSNHNWFAREAWVEEAVAPVGGAIQHHMAAQMRRQEGEQGRE